MNTADNIKARIKKHQEAQESAGRGGAVQIYHIQSLIIGELQSLLREAELQDYYDDLKSFNAKPEPWMDRQSGAFSQEELDRPDRL